MMELPLHGDVEGDDGQQHRAEDGEHDDRRVVGVEEARGWPGGGRPFLFDAAGWRCLLGPDRHGRDGSAARHVCDAPVMVAEAPALSPSAIWLRASSTLERQESRSEMLIPLAETSAWAEASPRRLVPSGAESAASATAADRDWAVTVDSSDRVASKRVEASLSSVRSDPSDASVLCSVDSEALPAPTAGARRTRPTARAASHPFHRRRCATRACLDVRSPCVTMWVPCPVRRGDGEGCEAPAPPRCGLPKGIVTPNGREESSRRRAVAPSRRRRSARARASTPVRTPPGAGRPG